MVALAGALAACGDNPPPTQIVLVVTATSAPGTPEAANPSDTPAAPTETPTPAPSAPATQDPGPQPTFAPLPPAPTLNPLFPTDVKADVQIAEQVFEHGRMFWIRHTREIWVMEDNAPDGPGGDWYCFNDSFEEGQPEIDPALIPPEGMYQPRRGFGKLWRTLPQIKDALGWALTPEFELTSRYTYIAGGHVDADGLFIVGPGEHRLTTLYGQSISFFERDLRGECLGGTWRMTN
jgi:hypothetical protein